MSGPDPRTTLIRDGLAAAGLEGEMPAQRYVSLVARRVKGPIAPLRRGADAGSEQIDELLFGELFDVLPGQDGAALGQARRDGYVGWVDRRDLAELGGSPTHWVSAMAALAQAEPSVRAPALQRVSLNTPLVIDREGEAYVHAADLGWIPQSHVRAIGEHETDFAAVAERHLAVPYRWGGRSSFGLDCSGLIMQCLFACGRGCPRDSDQQARMGEAADGQPRRRGDLVFWTGHVGMMLDAERLIHANAHAMMVAIESLAAARARILKAGGGDLTAVRRLPV